MGKFYDEIPGYVMAMIKKQHMFWVATAPLSADGHVNVSSKGVEGTFHIIDSHTVWYEDLSGSGKLLLPAATSQFHLRLCSWC